MTPIKIESQSPLVVEANLFLANYQRQYREHSVRAKQVALTQLIAYLSLRGIETWAQCDDRVLRQYIIYRSKTALPGSEKPLSNSSIETHLASIRIFFQYLQTEGVVQHNQARLVSTPKKGQRLPTVIEADLMNQILDRPPEDELEVRDLAILELLYSSGLRLAEIAGLSLADVDFQAQLVKVIDGKGGKDRIVPVGCKAIAALESWCVLRLNWLSEVPAITTNALFISKRGGQLSDRQISRRVKLYAEKSGIHINLHPHLLRHSMATHVLESSQDIRLVQELLGHADISTTQVYTHLNFNHLAKIFDAAHPRAKRSASTKGKSLKIDQRDGEIDGE